MQKSPYWPNEVYSLGYWLKDYAYYPKNWPLLSYMDHGVALYDDIPPHEIDNSAPIILKFSPRSVKFYKSISKKPVYCLVNPTIHYRRSHKIAMDTNAKGTLFYPAHTTDVLDDCTNWGRFIENLQNIPSHFHPVDICLHPTDVKKGLDKIFELRGYKVFTAGPYDNVDFVKNMYEILRNYKFSMSNIIGSYTFYSVEMGIPFSLYGPNPDYFNKGDKNIEQGSYTSYMQSSAFKKAYDLFKGLHKEINKEQLEFVEFELGIAHSISRIKASYLLYKAYIQCSYMRLSSLKKLLNRIKNRISRQLFS